MHFSPFKQSVIWAVVALGVLLILPSFFSRETVEKWPSWVPKKQLSLGLDLRGGAYLLYSMEPGDVRKDWLE
ncbi:hypothetical protein, partial [Salmonella enterica]|uniref:hypothetical protein n=1 Tax=Salmonella enterica TaxID=28901 RepID=UPI0018C89C8D